MDLRIAKFKYQHAKNVQTLAQHTYGVNQSTTHAGWPLIASLALGLN